MPSSASRACQLEVCGLVMTRSAGGALEVGHGLVGSAGAGQHRDQLPPVDAPRVEDRLGVVDQQRMVAYSPRTRAGSLMGATLAQPPGPVPAPSGGPPRAGEVLERPPCRVPPR